MNNKIIIIGIALTLILLNFVSALAVKNVEYKLKITFEPSCEIESCVSNYTDSGNSTINSTLCSTSCSGKIIVEGVEENNLFFEIDMASSEWKDGNVETRYGYKETEIGNESDISGIRQDLDKCLITYDNLLLCQSTLSDYDFNLSNCKSKIGSDNYTIFDCTTDKRSAENKLNLKETAMRELEKEKKDNENTKYLWGIIGVLIGFLGFKYGIPKMQGKESPRDETEKAFPSNQGY